MTEKELKELIVAEIMTQYKMNVSQFSNSEYPAKIGIQGGNTMRCYLTGHSSSVPFMKALCAFLKIGTLEKRKIVTTDVQFILHPLKTTPSIPVKRRTVGGSAKKTPRALGRKKA